MADETPPKEKDRFTTTLDGDLLEKIKILAVYEKCSTNVLLEEAIRDLLKKYEDKKAAQRKENQGQLFKNS